MSNAREESQDRPGIERAVAMQFMRYASGFWYGQTARRAWQLTLGLAGCLFLKLLVDVATNYWNRWFFDALENKDASTAFLAFLVFLVLVAAAAAVGVGIVITRERLQVRWRQWCTDRLLDGWLHNKCFYRLASSGSPIQNPEYRISDDIRMATEPLTDFAIMLFTAILALITFSSILWTVGGAFNVNVNGGTYQIPGFMLLGAIIYGVTLSSIIPIVGKNLSVAAARKNEAEANFRYEMIRLRESAECVIMARGEQNAHERLFRNYGNLVRTWLEVVRQHGLITWVTNSNGAMVPVAPLILCAPKYLSGELSLGQVMQLASAFVQVQLAIGWLVDHYRAIAEWFASARRITQLLDAYDSTDTSTPAMTIERCASDDQAICLEKLQLVDQSGRIIVAHAEVRIEHGEKVRLIGEPGAGKTLLARAVCGLWQWGHGRILLPEKATMSFIAETPFLPMGKLRESLTYPASSDDWSNIKLFDALDRAGVTHLGSQLDRYEHWDQTLSASECQRLAIARLILQHPDMIIMEDALSTLDHASQTHLFNQIVKLNPRATILLVSGPLSPAFVFDRTFVLNKSPGGSVLEEQTFNDLKIQERENSGHP